MNDSPRIASVSLVLAAVVSVQIGAAVAVELFDELGPAGTVLLRVVFSAVVLVALWRPSRAALARPGREVVLFGFVLAGMNLSFYAALERIPLGIAVTLEFVGPLGVAIAASRRGSDLAWAALAATGILLLSPIPGGSLDDLGVALALLAGAFWGAYILLAARVGRAVPGGAGLAVAMTVAAVVLVPIGALDGGTRLAEPGLLALGFAVAMLSSAIPYSLELEALRRLSQGVFGVLMSLEPAVAAGVGFVLLDQGLLTREAIAIALVIVASAGALRDAPPAVEA